MNRAIRIVALCTTTLAFALTPLDGAAQDSALLTRAEAARIVAIEGTARHQEACGVLSPELMSAIFQVDGQQLRHHPMQMTRIPHAVCIAGWDKPDKEAREAACKESMMDYSKRRVQAMVHQEKFDEPMPACPGTSNTVGLTIVNPVRGSAQEAVADLENAVGKLTEGIDFEVQGETHTSQIVFDSWIDGVGDRAAWSSEANELQVASDGVRFAVTVQVRDDPEENKALAIELARRLGG